MKRICIIFFFAIIYLHSFAAVPPGFTAKVLDAVTGQPLPGATISIPDLKATAIAGENGEFSFKTAPSRGRLLVEIRYVGYKTISAVVDFAAPVTGFAMQPSSQDIHEVLITGTAVSSGNKQNSTAVTSLNRAQLLTASTNLIDALARQVPGVSQITTGQAISKPVVRGLGFNRVVTLNDGVKQQGQQWGEEHGIEIDQFSPEKVEVLRGAASLLYGSDALGGVINFIEPLSPPDGTIKGELVSNYSTNNGLTGTSAMISGNENGLVWMGRGTYKNAWSFKTPTGYFPNSGFKENNLNGMIGLNRQWGYSHLAVSWFKSRIGFYEPELDGAGNYVDENGETFTTARFKSREISYPQQDIRHFKIGWNSNFLVGKGALKLNAGFQKNQRRELDSADPSLFFDLDTYSADLKYYLPHPGSWQGVLGLSFDDGRSVNKGTEVLVPAYNTYGFGAFGYAKKTWEKSTFNAGLRFDRRGNTGKELAEAGELIFPAFKNDFSNLSGALGFTHSLGENADFKANTGAAFRAPGPPELGSNGVHEGTFRYEIGNPGLRPERSYQADAAIEFGGSLINGSVGIYNNYIHDYIYSSNTPGDNITVDEGNGPETYPVYRYKQTAANLYGAEASLTVHLAGFAHLDNTLGYTHAQNITLNRPLAFIPAGSTTHVLRFEPLIRRLKDSYISAGIDNFFRQNRVDDTFETPAAGYSLINASLGFTVMMGKQPLKLSLTGNNLADRKYYSALSRLKPGRLDQSDPSFGVYDPGRNITFGLFLPFNL